MFGDPYSLTQLRKQKLNTDEQTAGPRRRCCCFCLPAASACWSCAPKCPFAACVCAAHREHPLQCRRRKRSLFVRTGHGRTRRCHHGRSSHPVCILSCRCSPELHAVGGARGCREKQGQPYAFVWYGWGALLMLRLAVRARVSRCGPHLTGLAKPDDITLTDWKALVMIQVRPAFVHMFLAALLARYSRVGHACCASRAVRMSYS